MRNPVTVKYAAVYQTITITAAEAEVVQHLYRHEMRVMAIKFLREQYGLGLKESKDICDTVYSMSVGTY